jgi:hypothetical protein
VLDPATHRVAVDLHNSTDKTVVAYSLLLEAADITGKQVESNGIGWDFAGPEPNRDSYRFIPPGQTQSITVAAAPNAVTARVTVDGVVYADKTYDGLGRMFFDDRSRRAAARRREAGQAQGKRKSDLEREAEWLETASRPAPEGARQ